MDNTQFTGSKSLKSRPQESFTVKEEVTVISATKEPTLQQTPASTASPYTTWAQSRRTPTTALWPPVDSSCLGTRPRLKLVRKNVSAVWGKWGRLSCGLDVLSKIYELLPKMFLALTIQANAELTYTGLTLTTERCRQTHIEYRCVYGYREVPSPHKTRTSQSLTRKQWCTWRNAAKRHIYQ